MLCRQRLHADTVRTTLLDGCEHTNVGKAFIACAPHQVCHPCLLRDSAAPPAVWGLLAHYKLCLTVNQTRRL